MNRSKLAQAIENAVVALIVCGAMLGSMLIVSSCKTVEIPDIDWPDDPLPTLPTWPPLPTTTTTTQPATVPAGDYPDLTSTAKGWHKWVDMKETCQITQVDMLSGGPRITSVCNPKWQPYDGKCDGFVCITWMHDGKRQGRYFDWRAVQSPYPYGWKHIMRNKDEKGKDGAFRFERPQKGDKVGLYFLSSDKQCRSNIYWFDWTLSKDANAKD